MRQRRYHAKYHGALLRADSAESTNRRHGWPQVMEPKLLDRARTRLPDHDVTAEMRFDRDSLTWRCQGHSPQQLE